VDTTIPVSEGFIPFRGYRTFYHMVGDLAQTPAGMFPVLTIHGRPVSHEALEPLEGLAESGRPVIFYDQLGCGNSDRPDDPSLWTISHFADEVDVVCRELELERVHLLGHSWGGVVAMEYALAKPSGIVSLILASTYASSAMVDADIERLREELPVGVLETLRRHEAAGTTDDPAYQEANRVFGLRHICRVDPLPEYLSRALERQPVGRASTEGWDIRARLSEISIPTLVTCGRYDMCTPVQAKVMHDAIGRSEYVVFEESSHYPHVEETDRYLTVVREFMARVEHQAVVGV